MNIKKKKIRLDDFLVQKGFFETKSQATANIIARKVKIKDEFITKAGFQINPDFNENIEIMSMPYVSRGGFKLEKALSSFEVNVKDRVCLDAGASTGGFTDCLLQNGAKKVYAADVGYGQLAWKIRNDDRVKVIEKTNLKHCEVKDIYNENEEIADIAVMDLSFISLTKVLNNIKNLLTSEKQEMIALIKPQFEAGKEEASKNNGVIRDKNVHVNVIKNIIDFACTLNLFPVNLTYSPIKGPAGNIEYLIHLSNNKTDFTEKSIIEIVDEANEQLEN